MPLNYGSSTHTLKRNSIQVGVYKQPQRGFSFTSLIRALIIVGEIALSFIPAIGTAGQIALGVAGATALTALDISEGYFSALNTFINFAGVGISTGIALRQGAKIARGVKQASANASSQLKNLMQVSGGYSSSARAIALQKRINDLNLISTRISRLENKVSLLRKLKILEKSGKLQTIPKISRNASEIIAPSKTLFYSISRASNPVKTLTKEEIKFVNEVIAKSEKISKIFKNDQLTFYKQILDPRTRPRDLRRLIKYFLRTITPEQAARINQYSSNFKQFLKGAARPLSLREPSIKKLVRFMGSSRYNDLVVQTSQNIDPNNLGRYLIERPYRLLKTRIERFNTKWLRATIKYSNKVSNAWTQAGGIWMGGEFINGYKVLTTGNVGFLTKNAVLINFNKENTAAKNKTWKGKATNNFGGKKDVIVLMSNLELGKLRDYGGDYYLTNYARNRGGKRAGGIAISDRLSLFLGFIPQNALRLNLSIISNLTKTIQRLSQGTYFSNWTKTFSRALIKTSINRSVRLLTRVLLPKLGVNKIFSQELSRFATASLTSGQRIKNGDFIFRFTTSALLRRTGLASLATVQRIFTRKLRKKGKTITAGTINSRRNLNQGVRRIPSSVFPNVSGRRIGRVRLKGVPTKVRTLRGNYL